MDQLFWNVHSEIDKLSENLTTLEVTKCDNLTSLLPSGISFGNLTTLGVYECHGLVNLVVSSAAKSLNQLTVLSIKACDKIEEVMTDVEDEIGDSIVFSQLNSLELDCLPNLAHFYSGSCKIEFPSLQKVVIKQCPKMETFSRRDLSTPRLHTLQIGDDATCWEGDLNTSIQKQCMRTT